MTFKLTSVALLALVLNAHVAAFTPIAFSHGHSARISTSPSSLHASVVSKFLTEGGTETETDAIREKFEKETPKSVGLDDPAVIETSKTRRRRNRRKHNFNQRSKTLHENPDLDFYTLHSSNVSHLEKDMPIEDILRAIKRAQNLHDAHDLSTIATFLTEACDEHWGYGFRGSLLSRLAVAALHMKELDIAFKAIDCRHTHERPTMKPHESAAIVRGLMRAQQVEDAWEVLEDELRLPLPGLPLDTFDNKELLKHRALALSSIVTRNFYEGTPDQAIDALDKISQMAPYIEESRMTEEELDMPWERLVRAALACDNNQEQYVVNAMMAFPYEQK